MNNILVALIESSLAMLLFYSIYAIWLKKETFFTANRFYLLFTAAFSVLLPYINVTLFNSQSNNIVFYNVIQTITVTATGYEQSVLQKLSGWQWAGIIYFTGLFISISLFIVKLFKLASIIKNGQKLNSQGFNGKIMLINSNVPPFTFFDKIYINTKNYNQQQIQNIVAHEKVHVFGRHTFDSIFYQLLVIVFWFNPIVYRYRVSALANHEFLADSGAINSGIEPINYQVLLVEQASGINPLVLTSTFNSLIKKRLVMITKIKSSAIKKVKLFVLLPTCAAVFIVFACNKATETDTYQQNTQLITNPVTVNNATDTAVFIICDQMPEFDGGDLAIRDFIANSIVYPQQAKLQGIEGRVFVQFVVNQKGDVEQVKIVRGVHPALDEEAVRVISILPKWKPGMHKGKPVNVRFTVPINYQLKNKK